MGWFSVQGLQGAALGTAFDSKAKATLLRGYHFLPACKYKNSLWGKILVDLQGSSVGQSNLYSCFRLIFPGLSVKALGNTHEKTLLIFPGVKRRDQVVVVLLFILGASSD